MPADIASLGLLNSEIRNHLQKQLQDVEPYDGPQVTLNMLSIDDVLEITHYQTDVQISLALAPLISRLDSLEKLIFNYREELAAEGKANVTRLDQLLLAFKRSRSS